jgi:hypothetical protein
MSSNIETLEIELLRLSTAERARLLDKLIISLDQDQELDLAWDKEAARRDSEIEEGTSALVDGKSVLARLRSQTA